jgi:general secretion pathway protein A
MYEAFFGLREKPFENTPDPRFFYASSQHQEACARLLYCIRERKGAGLLTGVFGCGKTVVGQIIRRELNQERYRSVFLSNPRLSDLDFLRMVAHELGIPHPASNKADVLVALEEIFSNNAKEGRDTVIFFDEAHAVSDASVFEELRLLLNYQFNDRFLVTLLLMGQPELVGIIEANKPFEQRIAIKSKLDPLSITEVRDYIFHRMKVAGHAHPDQVFSEEAIAKIYDSTGGVPRRLNRLCDLCLLGAMAERTSIVTESLIANEVEALLA